MSDTALQFRTSAFGGFLKQDVLDYIESANRAHTEQVEALKRQLEEAQNQCQAAEGKAADAEEKLSRAEQECTRLTEEAGQAKAKAEQLQASVDAQERELTQLRDALAQAQEKLEKAAPAAAAYESVKDRTAGIELEAHCRAQAVQNEAEAQVDKLRAQVEQWLQHTKSEYGKLRAELDGTISRATGELEQARQLLDGISSALSTQDGKLEKVARDWSGEMSHKPPEPLPLEEES